MIVTKKPHVLLAVLLCLSAFMKANPVDMRIVREVAVKFVNANTKTPLRSAYNLQLVTTYRTEGDDAAFHVFNTPNGFVIVAADDCAIPILAYSDEGVFDDNNIPIQMWDYLDRFVAQIQYGIDNRIIANDYTARQWDNVRETGLLNGQRSTTVVTPLITSRWNQNYPYNRFCPTAPGGPGNHAYAGCVAVAMGQIMRYWGYPETGQGSHGGVNFGNTTYQWNQMLDAIPNDPDISEIRPIATLLWHCGVAVDMQYSASGSGADVADVPNALVTYFKYSNNMQHEYKECQSDVYYTDSQWIEKIKNCLDIGRPILYGAADDNIGMGHAFVCDGYDGNDMLHFNWGWSGAGNAYYALGALNVTSGTGYNYYFNTCNSAIFNIHPYSTNIDFADANVKALCVANWDTNGDGELSYDEAAAVTDLGEVFKDKGNITSFNELQYFTGLTAIGDLAFYRCLNLTSIVIPSNVTALVGRAFMFCTSLTSIIIPDSVTSIGSCAFYGCYVLSSINIPVSVTSIGSAAFGSCEALTSIVIPNSVISIESEVFSNCNSLTQIFVEEGNPIYDSRDNCNAIIETTTNSLIVGCKSTVIPNSVISIGFGAFNYCTSLTSITIPSSVISIGNYAFYYCSGLTSITVMSDTPPAFALNNAANGVFQGVDKTLPVYVPCNSMSAYQNADGWNEFTNFQENCQFQTLELSEGWNWFSTYIEVTDPVTMLNKLKESLGENALQISSINDGTTEYDDEWIGELEEIGIFNEQMYLILAGNDCTITLEGSAAQPASYPIAINPGWNWIGFPCADEVEINVALAGFEAEIGDMIASQFDGVTEYDDEWIGDLETFVPGQGYLYYSASNVPRTLVFISPSRRK